MIGQEASRIRAVVVTPGEAHSAKLIERPAKAPGAHEIRLKIIAVGICGTDLEIVEGKYGEAPAGQSQLVIGHESLGVVEALGPEVTDWAVDQLAVPIVRRPCSPPCAPCQVGRWDLCASGQYQEHGIRGLDGFLSESVVVADDAAVPVPAPLGRAGVLVEPLSIVEKAVEEGMTILESRYVTPKRALVTGAGPVGILAAIVLVSRGLDVVVVDKRPDSSPKAAVLQSIGASYWDDSAHPMEDRAGALTFDLGIEASGYSPLVFRAARLLGRSGTLVLTGVSSGQHTVTVDSDQFNGEVVLENQSIVGSVNAARSHYLRAVADLSEWQQRWPLLLPALVTSTLPLERFLDGLSKGPDDIKTVIDVRDGGEN